MRIERAREKRERDMREKREGEQHSPTVLSREEEKKKDEEEEEEEWAHLTEGFSCRTKTTTSRGGGGEEGEEEGWEWSWRTTRLTSEEEEGGRRDSLSPFLSFFSQSATGETLLCLTSAHPSVSSPPPPSPLHPEPRLLVASQEEADVSFGVLSLSLSLSLSTCLGVLARPSLPVLLLLFFSFLLNVLDVRASCRRCWCVSSVTQLYLQSRDSPPPPPHQEAAFNSLSDKRLTHVGRPIDQEKKKKKKKKKKRKRSSEWSDVFGLNVWAAGVSWWILHHCFYWRINTHTHSLECVCWCDTELFNETRTGSQNWLDFDNRIENNLNQFSVKNWKHLVCVTTIVHVLHVNYTK